MGEGSGEGTSARGKGGGGSAPALEPAAAPRRRHGREWRRERRELLPLSHRYQALLDGYGYDYYDYLPGATRQGGRRG